MNDVRIMVTGGNGYVGRELARQLAPAASVCVLDNLRSGSWRFSDAERQSLWLEQADIRDGAALARLMADFRPHTVIHLAAIHYIPECESDPVLAVDTNITGSVELLGACPEDCGFVFASSGAVYQPDSQPHQEERSPLNPEDVYGLSKLHGEQYVRVMAARRRLRAMIVRLFNVVGPGETNPHLLPELVGQLKAGRNTIELGNLASRRDYIHVCDAATGFARVALNNPAETGAACVVNLGTGQPHTGVEMIAQLRAASGLDFKVRQDPRRMRASDRPVLAADMRRMVEIFGWRPSRTLAEAVKDAWDEPEFGAALSGRFQ